MVFDFRSNYLLGQSTLQGGSDSIDLSIVKNAIQESTVPDFQARNFNSTFSFSYDATEAYNGGKSGLSAGTDTLSFGASLFFNVIDLDPLQLLRYTPDIIGSYYEIRIGDFYGYTPDGQIYDRRVGVYRMGFFVNLERNPVGSRVATIVGTVYDGNNFTWAYDVPIWTSDAIGTPDGSGILRIEADVDINLLVIRRQSIAFYQKLYQESVEYDLAQGNTPRDPYDFTNTILAVSFRLFQNSGKDLNIGYPDENNDIYGAKIWFKWIRPLNTVDPDQFLGVPAGI